MDFEKLQARWNQYNQRLDNLEQLNRKLIMETLIQKPRKRLWWHRFQFLYGLIALPVIFILALQPELSPETMDWKFITGCGITFILVLYISYMNLKSVRMLRRIDLKADTVYDSARKIVDFRKHYHAFRRQSMIYFPILFAGILLISWEGIQLTLQNIIFLVLLFVLVYAFNYRGSKFYDKRLQRLEAEVEELKSYTD